MSIQRKELVKLVNSVNGEPRANSRIIAKLLYVEHEGFVRLLSRNKQHLEEFGELRFEVGARSDGNKGGEQPRTFFLTEDQCYFSLTLVRNTKQAVELKKRLVHEFSEARGNPRYQIEKKVQDLKQNISKLENEPLSMLGFQQLSLKDLFDNGFNMVYNKLSSVRTCIERLQNGVSWMGNVVILSTCSMQV